MFIEKAFLSLDLMCTQDAMKGEGDSHHYTYQPVKSVWEINGVLATLPSVQKSEDVEEVLCFDGGQVVFYLECETKGA